MIAEELGMIGSVLVLLLLFFVIWRLLRIADQAQDHFGRLIATGVAALIFFQVFVNVGMNLRAQFGVDQSREGGRLHAEKAPAAPGPGTPDTGRECNDVETTASPGANHQEQTAPPEVLRRHQGGRRCLFLNLPYQG